MDLTCNAKRYFLNLTEKSSIKNSNLSRPQRQFQSMNQRAKCHPNRPFYYVIHTSSILSNCAQRKCVLWLICMVKHATLNLNSSLHLIWLNFEHQTGSKNNEYSICLELIRFENSDADIIAVLHSIRMHYYQRRYANWNILT